MPYSLYMIISPQMPRTNCPHAGMAGGNIFIPNNRNKYVFSKDRYVLVIYSYIRHNNSVHFVKTKKKKAPLIREPVVVG